MKGAAAIAGLDGSAMHLAAFCRPGTKVTCFDSRHVQNQFVIEDLFELDAQHINVATVAASIAREALAT